MAWIDRALSALSEQAECGYLLHQQAASEPTALAALALFGHRRPQAALRACRWLADLQSADGSVGIRPGEPSPAWPTSLAVLAWHTASSVTSEPRWAQHVEAAIRWTLVLQGETQEQAAYLGHDTSLHGWPWVAGTHSWIEPTALHVVSLKATGYAHHARTREAVRLLLDRQLTTGGCNYGNTTVLGQQLRPHVQPTGIALLALAGQADARGRISRSLHYLRQALAAHRTPASLSWALLGLAAHGIRLPERDQWLEDAAHRVLSADQSPYKLALLTLAALDDSAPIVISPHHLPNP